MLHRPNTHIKTRLKILGLERLEIRRLYADLTMCYKIVHRLVNVPFDQFLKLTQHNSTRGHSLKSFYPDSRISARDHFFLCSCYLNMESPIPAALVQENNLSVFKPMLRTFDFSYTLLGKL